MGVMPFWVKNWTLSIVWAGILVNHLSWNGKCIERVFKKNSVKPNTASHNHSSWCTDTDGFLEHSPSRGRLYYKGPALQKIIPVSLGPALYRYSRTNLVTPWGKKKKNKTCSFYLSVLPSWVPAPFLAVLSKHCWNPSCHDKVLDLRKEEGKKY